MTPEELKEFDEMQSALNEIKERAIDSDDAEDFIKWVLDYFQIPY